VIEPEQLRDREEREVERGRRERKRLRVGEERETKK
jgi:hypothetical protein